MLCLNQARSRLFRGHDSGVGISSYIATTRRKNSRLLTSKRGRFCVFKKGFLERRKALAGRKICIAAPHAISLTFQTNKPAVTMYICYFSFFIFHSLYKPYCYLLGLHFRGFHDFQKHNSRRPADGSTGTFRRLSDYQHAPFAL